MVNEDSNAVDNPNLTKVENKELRPITWLNLPNKEVFSKAVAASTNNTNVIKPIFVKLLKITLKSASPNK
ncbi:hypothetical protein GCM10009409_11070 [Shewanella saliphila]|uniref:Uncharacterized protein n=1 Tax=Shewanella saliphila TaxID=2282698 RepID=A0ABQ2Q388_9GAMM|nr:hypothetical protein GCM10009409_11070 [Shewanella saliphila]